MPNEKKSADPAILPAVSAARGSSIMVPIRCGISMPCSSCTSVAIVLDPAADDVQLPHRGHQRDHDLRLGLAAGLEPGRRGLEDRPGLHGEQVRDGDAEPDAAQAEHGVLLVQALDGGEQLAVALLALAARVRDGQLDRELGEVGQELVQRRVDEPDRDRQPVHGLEDAGEVLALERQQLGEGGLLPRLVVGHDEVLDELAPLAEEHVLGAAQADALGPEPAGARGVLGRVGVRADLHPAGGVGVLHQPDHGLDEGLVDLLALEVAHHRRRRSPGRRRGTPRPSTRRSR